VSNSFDFEFARITAFPVSNGTLKKSKSSFLDTNPEVKISTNPVWAISILNKSLNLFRGRGLPTVFVGGTTLGILLKPNATPISSEMSH